MPKFSKEDFEVDGTIVVPDSWVCKTEGKITGVHNAGIVVYYSKTQSTCFYSFEFLNTKYGKDELNDKIPF